MSSEVYQEVSLLECPTWCYIYITLYRELERCHVQYMHNIGESWVWLCEAISRNLIIV
jgi:hypothetical protein